jgi:hypothetical protein
MVSSGVDVDGEGAVCSMGDIIVYSVLIGEGEVER